MFSPMENKTSMSDPRKYSIPEEIMSDIFSRLPVDSLMRFKCLSKFYNSLVSDPSFIDIHQSRSIFRPHKIKILAHSRDENIFYTIEQQAEHKKTIVIEEFDGTPGGEIVCIFDQRNLILFYDLKKKSWREIKITELADKLEIVGIYSQANNRLPCIYC
ncbi:hypothetical protein R3W88_013666 [Solanum pinnatisectum]|uniref:F-box domain-containing protein n=1 Tax=Solanum pinnatisectum TaxID=50273 RepID=A0AAV9KPU8_9SOLN|nr:hypothetical protein R3W88_013666 [Solanum pinnatisectum]